MGPDNGKKARRPPLTGLDKRVFEILWMQLTEDPARIMDELPPPRELIDMVRGEDPTLRRQKALLLENCVNRVVPHLRQRLSVFSETMKGDQDSDGFENADSGSDADDNSGSGSGGGGDAINRNASFSDLDQKSTSVPLVTIKPTNSLNKSLTRFWANNSNPPKAVAATAAAAAAAVKTSERPTMQAMTLEPGLVVDPKSTGETSTPATPAGEKRRPAGDEKGRKRRKNKTTSEKDPYLPPPTRLKDLGGVEPCIEEILELIVMPMRHPEIYLHTGVQPPRGVLLHGPPGCGKTMLANAIAGELGVPFIQISAPSVVSGMSGESEKKLRDMFQEAKSLAPCLVFIDEIDAITPKRETAQREMERRIVAQLLTCMDDLSWDKTDNKPVMMIGATNRPDSLDPALRRAGRFDREIAMGVPDDEAREKILRVLCRKLRLAGDFDYAELAKRTPGYVGADLNALTTAAGMIAVKRIFHEMRKRLPQSQIVASLGISDGGSGDHDDHEEEEEERMEVEPGAPGNTDDDDNNNNNNNNEGWDNQAPEDKLQWLSAFLEAHPEPLSEEELAPLAITNVDFVEALKK
ncbi:Ribosome biogenesis ATPase rix7, partial [Spiromyces aspiralis]